MPTLDWRLLNKKITAKRDDYPGPPNNLLVFGESGGWCCLNEPVGTEGSVRAITMPIANDGAKLLLFFRKTSEICPNF